MAQNKKKKKKGDILNERVNKKTVCVWKSIFLFPVPSPAAVVSPVCVDRVTPEILDVSPAAADSSLLPSV